MMHLQYRDAVPEDLPQIVDIYNSTIAGRMVTADTSPVTVESRHAWFRAHNPERRPLWMVYDDAVLVGWISFSSFYGRPAYDGTVEVSIYLAESARGKGYGKAVLQHAIDVAPQYAIHTLLGFIFAHNIPSLKLFAAKGFTEWAHLPDVAILDGQARTLKILGLKVTT